MALSSCEMALVIGWPVHRLSAIRPTTVCSPRFAPVIAVHIHIANVVRRSPESQGCAFIQSQTHFVWYLIALCQRTVEVKERCQSVPFGYQRPADGLTIQNVLNIVNTKCT